MVKVNKKKFLDSYDLPGHKWKATKSYSDLEMGLLQVMDIDGRTLCAIQYKACKMPLLIPEEQFNELLSSL